MTRADRYWAALRALPAAAIVRALGSGFETHDDPAYGVSVRRLGGAWDWPEWALADAARINIREAQGRLLAAARELADEKRKPGRAGALARLAESLT
ncbi:MAG: hypothetical protein ACREK5_10755 [Gemmatimonadota bacterium]